MAEINRGFLSAALCPEFILEKAVHPRKSLKERKKSNRYKNAERNL
jgi:hypothetical protein